MLHKQAVPVEQQSVVIPVVRPNAGAGGHRIFHVVFDDFRQRIRRGEWLPGERLPSITRLATDLHVSTTSVREALRSLQGIGLVRIEHGRGVFVTGAHASTDIAHHLDDEHVGLLVALAETRRLVEPELAALAAERATNEELVAIAALAQQMDEQARNGENFVDPDVQFHRSIAWAARNPILRSMMESVDDLLLESRHKTAQELGMTARAVRYHQLIADALHDRNAPQARLLMLAHMNDALSGVLAAEANAVGT